MCGCAIRVQDTGRARELYTRAAATGHAAAKRQLGTMVMTGVAGEVNVANALLLWHEAATLEDPESALYLSTVAQWAQGPGLPWNLPPQEASEGDGVVERKHASPPINDAESSSSGSDGDASASGNAREGARAACKQAKPKPTAV